MTPNERAAADRLAATARDKIAGQIAVARETYARAGSYEEALGELTIHFVQQSQSGVAALASAALLQLAADEEATR